MEGKEIIILEREKKKVCGYDEEFELLKRDVKQREGEEQKMK